MNQEMLAFARVASLWWACQVWAEIEAYRSGYPFDPSGGDAGNEVFAQLTDGVIG